MSNQDHSTITLQEAQEWVEQQCRFEHNRKRLRSRAVAWRLNEEILALQELVEVQGSLIKKLLTLDEAIPQHPILHEEEINETV